MSVPPVALIVITLMGYNPNKEVGDKSPAQEKFNRSRDTCNCRPVTKPRTYNLELLADLSYLEMCA